MAVPRFVGWAAAGKRRPSLPAALECAATPGFVELHSAIAADPDPQVGGRRRVRLAFDGELARSLIEDPSPANRRWTTDMLGTVSAHGFRPHAADLIGVSLRWVSVLDDCVMHGMNAVDARELPDEFALREFIRIDADDDDQLCSFIRTWGPLDYPDADFGDLSVTPADELRSDHWVAAGHPPFAGLVDPESRAPWWHDCLGRLHSLVDNVDGDDWKPAFVPFKTSECGDFGIHVEASPTRVQRALVHLYQALFESWIVILTGRSGPTADADPPWGLNPLLVKIWRHHHLEAPWSEEAMIEAVTALLNAGVQPMGPRVAVDISPLGRGRSWVGKAYPRISSALCMQVLAFIAEGLPAKVCQNETCGKYFVRQQGRAAHAEFRTTGVRYCTDRCARVVAQRSYRRRKAVAQLRPADSTSTPPS